MRYVYFSKLSILALIFMGMVSCFKKPGESSAPTFSTAIPITPVYNESNLFLSYLRANGPCQGNSVIVFTYSSKLIDSPSTVGTRETVKEGNCSGDMLDIQLPVEQGDKKQTFTVKMVGKKKNNSSAAVITTVTYSPTPKSVAGFAIVAGGGTISGGNFKISGTIGEPYSATQRTQSGGGVVNRIGVQGALDP